MGAIRWLSRDGADRCSPEGLRPAFHHDWFSLSPSSSPLPVLPDASPVDDAVNYILLTLRKSASSASTAESCRAYSQAIQAQTGVQSIGELRVLTDGDFRALQIPAMLRIYLKHLVRGTQSGRLLPKSGSVASSVGSGGLIPSPSGSPAPAAGAGRGVDPFMQALQNDFNYGQPFDLSQYKSHLDTLSLMGFSHAESMEALCIVENKNVDAACELLLSTDASQRKEKRARVVDRLGKQAKPDAMIARRSSSNSAGQSGSNAGGGGDVLALQNELALVRAQVMKERNARVAQSAEYKLFVETTLPLKIYSEYLKSLLVKEYLLPVEMEQLNKYRERNHIDALSHSSTLAELGIESASALDSLVKKVDKNKGGAPGAGGNMQQPGDMDCVVCLDKPKTYIIQSQSERERGAAASADASNCRLWFASSADPWLFSCFAVRVFFPLLPPPAFRLHALVSVRGLRRLVDQEQERQLEELPDLLEEDHGDRPDIRLAAPRPRGEGGPEAVTLFETTQIRAYISSVCI
jgi:hypothetical protein